MFVALSINVRTVLDLPGAPGRAGEALVSLVEPVVLGLTGLIPSQSPNALGVEWVVTGIFAWLVVAAILRRRRAMLERKGREVAVRIGGVGTASLLVLVVGALLVAGVSVGL